MNDETRNARLEALIAAFGRDTRRWPEADRAHLIDEAELDRVAGSREADALDRLLDEAASRNAAPAPDALIEAILAKAGPREAADVVPLGAGAKPLPGVRPQTLAPRPRASAAAAVLMAASLAAGLFVGSLTTTQTTVARIGTLAGLELGAASPATPLEDDLLAADEEDIL